VSAPPRSRTANVITDPRDAQKTAATFFAEMPWDGRDVGDARQWSSSRFFELFLGADSALDD